jgi:hypothetical protein
MPDKFIQTKARIGIVCKMYGVSESFVRHALMDRKLTPYKVGKMTFVDLPEFEKLIHRGRVKK